MASPQLKYYIHDSIDACRLQLIGTFTSAHVNELEGCWKTARTTLGERKLIVDVAAVDAMDDPGRKWIAVMVAEGANIIEKAGPRASRVRAGLFRRMVSCLLRTAEQSPTQAQ